MSIRIRVCALIVKDDTVLLVKHQKEGREYWLLPGGGVDEGEDLNKALARELKEETSFDVRPEDLLFVCESIDHGGRHVLHICLKSTIISGDLKVNPDNRLKDARFFSKNELKDLTIYPDITQNILDFLDGKGIGAGAKYLGNLWH